MRHRRWVALGTLLVLSACGGGKSAARSDGSGGPGAAGDGSISLASGTRVTVAPVQRARWPHSGRAFQVNYATSLPMADTARLAAEARALWDVLRPDAERAGACGVILQAQAPPTIGVGGVRITDGYALTFVRDPADGWRRLVRGSRAPPPPCAD